MKKKLIVLALCAAAFPALASADPLAQMQADASALSQMNTTWAQLASTAQSYAALAPYDAQEWSGQGPVVTTEYGGMEQCHNTHWDSVTSSLITGGMNIAGDAEAEAYAMQEVTVDFQQQLANYMIQQVQANQNQALLATLEQQNGPLIQSLTALDSLLTTVGNQVANAMGPNTALHPLDIQNWQAGIGNVPDLAAVQYIAGLNDGAPVGWSARPASPLAKLIDDCPTGTGTIPMLPVEAPVLSAAQQAITDGPALAQQLAPLESGSTYTAPDASGYGFIGGEMFDGNNYAARESLVSDLASDMQPLAAYMQPISSPLMLYTKQVQQIMNEVNSNAQS
ncbi:hypothetical protein [Acidithiobacillus sp.]|uniref:hypothetical protein n=1 Tax=Acidithiobacillus sp. TaxID=1872118 RepID=UPI003D01EEA1